MQVEDKTSMSERVESEEGGLWRLGDGRDGEEPRVGGGRLGDGEEGESGAGRFKDGDESRSEDGQAVRAKERRLTNMRMRESEVRQEITGDRRGLVREGELTSEV
jgi:hypothetical protein